MISDEEAQLLLERAYGLGIRFFDTGFNYGFAEERLGKILRESKIIKRDDLIISTKFGERLVNGKWQFDWSPYWMKRSVDISMKRLGIDHLDMLMCHGGELENMPKDLFLELYKLKERKIVRAIGINTFSTDVIKQIIKTKCFDFVMLDYNILRQDREPLIKELYETGIGVIAGAPLAESLYSNRIFQIKRVRDLWYLARAFKNFKGQMIRGYRYRFINNLNGMTGSQIALKYVLDNPLISSAVFGTTTMSHLEDNVKAQDIVIPDKTMQKIRQIG